IEMLVILLVAAPLIIRVSSFTQSVGVRGQIICGNSPLPNTEVTIWENTSDPPTDGLATTTTDASGRFSLSATVNDPSFPMQVLRIYPSCSSDQAMLGVSTLCQREATYQIPASYVSLGSIVFNWYQMGTMNMQARQQNEQIHCTPNPLSVSNQYGYSNAY
ncbi:hypothetical protein PENTCL1PPCAC_21797, partial [Pristionchus entomophagus]